MKHVALAVLFGFVALMNPAPSQAGRILPKITSVTWYSLAVTNFAAAPGLEETAAEMTRSVRDILAHSGPFPFTQSDELNAETVGIDAPPQFSFWRNRGIGLLVVASVKEAPDGRLEVGFRLWNTFTEGQVAGKTYLASPEFKDRLARTLAGEIFEILDDNYRSVLSKIDRR